MSTSLSDRYEKILTDKTGIKATVLPPHSHRWVDLSDSGFIGCLLVTETHDGNFAVWLPYQIYDNGTPFEEAA